MGTLVRMLAWKMHIMCTVRETQLRRYMGASAWLKRHLRVEKRSGKIMLVHALCTQMMLSIINSILCH